MKIFLVVLLLVLIALGYSGFHFVRKVRASMVLVAEASPYTRSGDGSKRLLVIGDSTAVGVGADKPADSLAARVADEIHATDVENHAVSGARVRDLLSQIGAARNDSYAYILIGIGANDVVRFMPADEAAIVLTAALKTLPSHKHLVVYMAGNVGGTQLFPTLLNPQYTKRTLAYHAAFDSVVKDAGGTYVNLYVPAAQDPFIKNPQHYLAADGFHPCSSGYLAWFEKIRPVLQ